MGGNRDPKSKARHLIAAGNMEAAYRVLSKLCNRKRADAESWYLYTGASASLERYGDVVKGCRRMLEFSPKDEAMWNNLGTAYFKLGRLTEAVSAYQATLEINPASASALGNLGAAFLDLGDPENAITYCDKALALNVETPETINTLGIAMRELGRYKEALDCFERASQISPEFADARWNRALCLLKLCRFSQGWDEFEWRWKYEQEMVRSTPYPGWTGDAPYSTLLIYAEQGIGDQIMFASCLEDLLPLSGRVIIECEPRLLPIFSRSFPDFKVHGGSWDERLPECSDKIDYQIPMGSLPQVFRRDRKSFPKRQRYIVPDQNQVESWRNTLEMLGDGLKVGISWGGGKDKGVKNKRTIPLSEWSEIFGLKGVVFVDVQYGNRQDELKIMRDSGIKIQSLDGIDAMKDMDSFANMISALDIIISVDNSTLHLAGSLGVEAWGLLPYDSDWRWEQGVENSVWYSSVSLLHQSERGRWSSVLDQVKTRLSQRVLKQNNG